MALCRRPAIDHAPKTTRVPVDGITSFFGISLWTAMIVLSPVQCIGRFMGRLLMVWSVVGRLDGV